MNEQELQQAFIQFLAQKTGAKSQQELEAVIQQLGEEGLKQAYAEFMQVMQQQQVRAAKFGAKLNYIKQLRGQCPDGYEPKYFKKGGVMAKECVACKKEAEEVKEPSNPIDAFKCGRKMKKKENGGIVKDQNPAGPLKPKTTVSWPATKDRGFEYQSGGNSYATGGDVYHEGVYGPNDTFIYRNIYTNSGNMPNDTIVGIKDNSGREQYYRNGESGFRVAHDRAFSNAVKNTKEKKNK